jgi:hypothetical protein
MGVEALKRVEIVLVSDRICWINKQGLYFSSWEAKI